ISICMPVSLSMSRGRAGATPFPYTTLFRSASPSVDGGHQPLHQRGQAFPIVGVEGVEQVGQQVVRPVSNPGVQLTTALVRRDERSEEHTSVLQSRENLVCRLLLEKDYAKLR